MTDSVGRLVAASKPSHCAQSHEPRLNTNSLIPTLRFGPVERLIRLLDYAVRLSARDRRTHSKADANRDMACC